jgi:hypothetical protein
MDFLGLLYILRAHLATRGAHCLSKLQVSTLSLVIRYQCRSRQVRDQPKGRTMAAEFLRIHCHVPSCANQLQRVGV